ncbi:hypothetical protein IW492_07190 [Enterococcus sp. BWB1-3]|nr:MULTISPECIES: hypothetical protein [unclassified Enterococcus]MBL1229017.1 hypothetical protein [Enterococcus sp. BWB1-3]MCB5955485.1 hypothetical protein [Enterococcus sp. CWB-B31]
MKLTEKRTEALKANRLLDLSMVNQNFPAQKLGESLPIDNRSYFQYLIEL